MLSRGSHLAHSQIQLLDKVYFLKVVIKLGLPTLDERYLEIFEVEAEEDSDFS